MTDTERRAVIEYHVAELAVLTKEPAPGYGLMKKESIVTRARRILELAESLEG